MSLMTITKEIQAKVESGQMTQEQVGFYVLLALICARLLCNFAGNIASLA